MEGVSKVGDGSKKKALKTEVFRAKPTYKPIFFHPDYTVGTGVSPVQSSEKEESRAFTAGGDLPLLRAICMQPLEECSPRPENLTILYRVWGSLSRGHVALIVLC